MDRQEMRDPLINIEAEAEILGQLLSDNTLFDSVADVIEPNDFSEPLHERIYDVALSEVMAGNAANPVTLRAFFASDPEMKDVGEGYLFELTSVVSMRSVKDIAKHLRELSVRRFMRAGLSDAMNACTDMGAKSLDIIDIADNALAVRSKDTIHQPSGAECLDELLDSYENKVSGVNCGQIGCLDELLGSMRPKQLVIGAGRPGMGKTAVALSYAIGAARRGHGVLFVSLEMSSTELAARMASDICFDESRIPFSAIRDGSLSHNQKRDVVSAGSMMRGLPFQVIDAGSLTISRLGMLVRRHARRMQARGQKLELVVVDYLQLLSPDGRGKSAYEAVSEVSRGLKALAKDNALSVLALAQLSREVEKRPDRRPMLSDLRDSGQIEQDADSVLFLLRNEYYLRQDEKPPMDPKRAEWEQLMEDNRDKIEFILAKRRNGTTGSAIGNFHGAFQAVRG